MDEAEGARQQRRRMVIGVSVGCLFVGLLFGAAIGSGEEQPAETVTEVSTVTKVKTKRVPVVKVKTVTQVRRVVRTETVTVAAEPVDAAVEADAGAGAGGGDDYAGLNCSEIGYSFSVTPGSDPEHDADNDGIACESY